MDSALYGQNEQISSGGGPGYTPLLGNVFSDGIRACVWRAKDGIWLIKSLGKEHWGVIPTGSTTAGCDVMCQNGSHEDIPIVGNVFGDGTNKMRTFHSSLLIL